MSQPVYGDYQAHINTPSYLLNAGYTTGTTHVRVSYAVGMYPTKRFAETVGPTEEFQDKHQVLGCMYSKLRDIWRLR